MLKKPKKTVTGTKQDQYGLQTLQKNQVKQYVFSTQFSRLIDTIPDVVLLKDREGRKLVTNQLTNRLFKLHDLDWYGKSGISSLYAPLKIRAHKKPCWPLQSELEVALEKQQLQLYYQIQVNGSGQILGAETLLRWEHPQYGLLTSDQIIPIAEQTGLILPIGAWVLKTACEQLKHWQSDPLKKDFSLAVNISPLQFCQPGFVEELRQVLEETGIDATRLKLELNESLMLHDISSTIEKMEALQLLGIRFSMDNFGTGYSSLSQLKALPIDQLKIDPLLMRDITIDSGDAMLVKTLIDMTCKLRVDVIGGGVETEQQFACLKQLGCTVYQGYLFGKPMPLNEFENSISVGRAA
jgi:EAL domain-containing protein (putative c-di-GMP-specific phosphodiesterase class I)